MNNSSKMSRLLTAKMILLILFFSFTSIAQAQIIKKIGNKVKKEANKKIDKVLEPGSPKEDKPSGNNTATFPSDTIYPGNKNKAAYKSKFDFIPGEEVYYFYDFSNDSTGDIPAGWQIDGSAEVADVIGYPGHYLMINDHSSVIPESFDDLAEELTIQFDLICTDPLAWGDNPLYFVMANTDPNKTPHGQASNLGSSNNSVFWIGFHPGSQFSATNKGYGSYELRSPANNINGQFVAEAFTDKGEGRFAKISIWRQKQRVRVYVNENKVLDLSSALPKGMMVNTFAWSVYSYSNAGKYFVGNIRIAKGMPDNRKSFLQSGKYVTTGILFNTNSAEIKPESYGILKEIAGNISANPGIKLTITGHTDSDGDETYNKELSKQRAESVKKSLTKDFNVSGDMLSTDGKGASEPVAPNDTPQNKAKNRRVEFIVVKQ